MCTLLTTPLVDCSCFVALHKCVVCLFIIQPNGRDVVLFKINKSEIRTHASRWTASDINYVLDVACTRLEYTLSVYKQRSEVRVQVIAGSKVGTERRRHIISVTNESYLSSFAYDTQYTCVCLWRDSVAVLPIMQCSIMTAAADILRMPPARICRSTRTATYQRSTRPQEAQIHQQFSINSYSNSPPSAWLRFKIIIYAMQIRLEMRATAKRIPRTIAAAETIQMIYLFSIWPSGIMIFWNSEKTNQCHPSINVCIDFANSAESDDRWPAKLRFL